MKEITSTEIIKKEERKMARITINSKITKSAIRNALRNDDCMTVGVDLSGRKIWRDDPEARLIMEVRTFRDQEGWTLKKGPKGEEIPRNLTLKEMTNLLAKKWAGKRYSNLPA